MCVHVQQDRGAERSGRTPRCYTLSMFPSSASSASERPPHTTRLTCACPAQACHSQARVLSPAQSQAGCQPLHTQPSARPVAAQPLLPAGMVWRAGLGRYKRSLMGGSGLAPPKLDQLHCLLVNVHQRKRRACNLWPVRHGAAS